MSNGSNTHGPWRIENMRRMATMWSRIGVGVMVAVLLAVAPAMAEVRVGGVGGLNLASLSTDEQGVKLGTLTRWGVGGALELDLTERLAVVSRPMFIGKGADIKTLPELGDVAAQGKDSYARTELGYIELPLLFKYSLTAEGVRPYLIAGPSLGVLRNATGVSKFGSAPEQREDIKGDFKSTDFSLCAGAGLGKNIGPVYLFAEGLYALGLTNIDKDKSEGSGKNRGLQFRAGITLRLGGR
jgi:hypothetical protein